MENLIDVHELHHFFHVFFFRFVFFFFRVGGLFSLRYAAMGLPNTSRIRIPRRTTCLQHEVLNPRRNPTLKGKNLKTRGP